MILKLSVLFKNAESKTVKDSSEYHHQDYRDRLEVNSLHRQNKETNQVLPAVEIQNYYEAS